MSLCLKKQAISALNSNICRPIVMTDGPLFPSMAGQQPSPMLDLFRVLFLKLKMINPTGSKLAGQAYDPPVWGKA
jgi:hypothetical protein